MVHLIIEQAGSVQRQAQVKIGFKLWFLCCMEEEMDMEHALGMGIKFNVTETLRILIQLIYWPTA